MGRQGMIIDETAESAFSIVLVQAFRPGNQGRHFALGF